MEKLILAIHGLGGIIYAQFLRGSSRFTILEPAVGEYRPAQTDLTIHWSKETLKGSWFKSEGIKPEVQKANTKMKRHHHQYMILQI